MKNRASLLSSVNGNQERRFIKYTPFQKPNSSSFWTSYGITCSDTKNREVSEQKIHQSERPLTIPILYVDDILKSSFLLLSRFAFLYLFYPLDTVPF